MTFWEMLLLALSLSVDSFAVSVSGSVTLGRITFKKILYVAFIFGLMQSLLLFSGWLLGSSFVVYVHKIARYIAFILLSYIGGSMIYSSFRKDEDSADLSGLRCLLLAALATSIDAVAVGVSMVMSDMSFYGILSLSAVVFAVTMSASGTGVAWGCAIGRRFGKFARTAGGAVLVLIGLNILLQLY